MIFLWRRLKGGGPPDEFTIRILRRIRRPELEPWEVAARRLKELAALERYERRAFSRRRSALRAMDELPDAFLAERTSARPGTRPADARGSRGTAAPATASPRASNQVNSAKRTPAKALSSPTSISAPALQYYQWGPALLRNAALQSATATPPDGEPDAAHRHRVREWAWAGVPYERIARRLRISFDELRRDYLLELECAAAITSTEASATLMAKACGGDVTAAIYLLKNRFGWRESPPRRKPPPPPPIDVKQQLIDRIMNMVHPSGAIREGPQ